MSSDFVLRSPESVKINSVTKSTRRHRNLSLVLSSGDSRKKTLELIKAPINHQLWTSRTVGLVVAGKQNASFAGVKRAESKKQELFSPTHLPHRQFSLANWSLQICAHTTDCCLKSN